MKIKKSLSEIKYAKPKIENGKKIVYEVHVKDFLKDDGTMYYSNLRGTFAYLFDNPKNVTNCVLINWDNPKESNTVLNIAQYIHHLIFWRANVMLRYPIVKELDIYPELTNPHKNTISNICNSITKRMVDKEDQVTERICNCISRIKEDLSVLAEGWSSIQCNTISIHDIIEFKNRSPKFRNLLNTVLSPTMTIKEVELKMKELEKELVQVIEEDNKNCFAPYLRSGRIKSGQLVKILCAVGTRPDIDKTIMPMPIQKGYIHGLQNAAEYFMESVTARDAMLTKSQNVPLSGFLSREINRLTSDININYKVDDCGTKNYLKFEIKNEDYLKIIEDKYYYSDDNPNKLKVATTKDTHLIGKTVNLRSIIGCCCKDGVCRTCVGTVSKRLKKTRMGTLPAIKVINPLSQKSMSAKHDLGTKSHKLTNLVIKRYFYNEGVNFFLRPEFANKKDLFLTINQEEIEELISSNSLNNGDGDELDIKPRLSYIALRDGDVEYPLDNDGMEISLSDETLQNKNTFFDDEDDSNLTLIPLNKLSLSDPIFIVTLYTEEISKYLNTFIASIDRATVSTKYKSYHELIHDMNDIVYESGFVNKMIHYESIARNMIRSKENATKRPDMSIEGVEYQILNISNAIEKKDMYSSLSFQGLRRLFKSIDIRVRYGTSVYDPFFRISELY